MMAYRKKITARKSTCGFVPRRRNGRPTPAFHETAKFDIPWKITSEQFDDIPRSPITKFFITVYKNVAIKWRAELAAGTKENAMSFKIFYDSGPLEKIELDCLLSLETGDYTYEELLDMDAQEIGRGSFLSEDDFDVTDGVEFRRDHELNDNEPIVFRITVKITIGHFLKISTSDVSGSNGENVMSSDVQNDDSSDDQDNSPNDRSSSNLHQAWFKNQFATITDREKVECSDVTLISADKKEFCCHRLLLVTRSDALKVMFRNATTEEEKKGIFRFPTINGNVLHTALEFLYMFDVDLVAIAFPDIVTLADFAEQYGLKKLKGKCIFELWKQIVDRPTECVSLIRIADLHDDMKYLKDRCFDILAENYEDMSLHSEDPFKSPKKRKRGDDFGNNQDDRLRTEFYFFMNRRVTPGSD